MGYIEQEPTYMKMTFIRKDTHIFPGLVFCLQFKGCKAEMLEYLEGHINDDSTDSYIGIQ